MIRRLSGSERTALSNLYRLLGRLWWQELDKPLLDALSAPPFNATLGLDNVPPDERDQLIADLGSEYCRLFIGPADHLPPYQSVWSEGRLESHHVDSMTMWLELARLDRRSIPTGTMVDHIGVQLHVIGTLLAPHQPWESHSEELAEMVDHFHEQHVNWPEPLFDAVESRAEHPLYRELAKLCRALIAASRPEKRAEK